MTGSPSSSSSIAEVPSPRRGHGAVFYPKRREIIIFGGTVGGITEGGLLNDVWIFSLVTRTWARAPGPAGRGGRTEGRGTVGAAVDFDDSDDMKLPPARRGCASFLLDDGLFVVGGDTPAADGYFDPRIWRLDLTTWRWKVQLRSSEIKAAAGAAVTSTTTGGDVNGGALGCCYARLKSGEERLLDPDFWPGPFFSLSTAAVVGRDIWFFGGSSPPERASDPPMDNVLYRLRCPPSSNDSSGGGFMWTLFEPYDRTPAPRFCHGIAAVGGAGASHYRVGYFGGDQGGDDHGSAASAEPSLNSSSSSSPSLARYLVLFGGTGQDGRSFDDVHLFDTQLFTWRRLLDNSPTGLAEINDGDDDDATATKSLRPSPRNGFSMVPQGNKVVVFGGGVYPRQYYDCTFAFDLNLPLEPPPRRPTPAPFARTPFGGLAEGWDLTLLPGPPLSTGSPSLSSFSSSSTTTMLSGSPCRAHRRLLAARCPYFRTMLGVGISGSAGAGTLLGSPKDGGDDDDDNDDGLGVGTDGGDGDSGATFAEATMDVIRLPDVPEDTLRVTLHYLYTGRLSFRAAERREKVRAEEDEAADYRDVEDEDDEDEDEDDVPSLGADGYESAQHVMHVASLWALDHLKELVEDAVLRELLAGHGREEKEQQEEAEKSAPSRQCGDAPATSCLPAALAVPLLSLAEAHQARKLRLFAMHALVRNWDAVRVSDDFASLSSPLRKEAEWYARSLLL